MVCRTCRQFAADEAGQIAVEYTLLIAAFGIPYIVLARFLLGWLVEHYRMVSCMLSLPLP